MKKKYVNPITDIFGSELSDMVCASQTTVVTGGANWGGEGEYAPGDWINEGQETGETGGYSTTPIEDDEWDLPSRGKEWGDLWF